jgi:DNA-binding NarL/FixJ family response regulator
MNGSADIVLVDHDDDAPPIRDIRAQYSQSAACWSWTAGMDHESSAQLVRDGRHGIVSKGRTGDHLVAAIRKVHAGEMWVDRVVATTLMADLQRPGRRNDADRTRIASLTARERDVVNLVGEGLANKAIAERLSHQRQHRAPSSDVHLLEARRHRPAVARRVRVQAQGRLKRRRRASSTCRRCVPFVERP